MNKINIFTLNTDCQKYIYNFLTPREGSILSSACTLFRDVYTNNDIYWTNELKILIPQYCKDCYKQLYEIYQLFYLMKFVCCYPVRLFYSDGKYIDITIPKYNTKIYSLDSLQKLQEEALEAVEQKHDLCMENNNIIIYQRQKHKLLNYCVCIYKHQTLGVSDSKLYNCANICISTYDKIKYIMEYFGLIQADNVSILIKRKSDKINFVIRNIKISPDDCFEMGFPNVQLQHMDEKDISNSMFRLMSKLNLTCIMIDAVFYKL